MNIRGSSEANSPPGRRRFWHQLRWNLIIYFVMLTVPPIAGVITLTLIRTSNQAREQIFNQLWSVSELKEDQITRWINNSNTLLHIILLENKADLMDFASKPLPDDHDQAFFDNKLTSIKATQDIFEEFFLYTPEGKILASSNPIQVGKIVSAKPYFAASLEGGMIHSPDYDIGTGTLTIIMTDPLIDVANGRVVGVLGGRLNTSTLGQIMTNRTGLGESGETYLINAKTNFLLTPSRYESEGYHINRIYHSEGIDRVLRGETGAGTYLDYRDPPQMVLGVYRWIPELQVGMLAEIDEAQVLAPLIETNNFSITIAVLAALSAVAIGLYKATRISSPIMALTQIAGQIAAGDLKSRASITSNDEFAALGNTFNHMTEQLHMLYTDMEQQVADRTAELTATTRELQRIATDLERKNRQFSQELILAHNIQLGLLPNRSPWDPGYIAAYGQSIPAAEVGGDFYTFTPFRETHRIGIVIGDISGKGVAAALIMALVFSAVETQVQKTLQPATLLTTLNQQLYAYLKPNHMNAALCYVLIDMEQQVLWAANAGMIAPFLLRNGRAEMIDVGGLPLGAVANTTYGEAMIKLEPDDRLVLLSDGVVEAHNGSGEIFGFERLEQILSQQSRDTQPRDIVSALIQQTMDFGHGTDPHDDMTIVVVAPQLNQQPLAPSAHIDPHDANVVVIDDAADNLRLAQRMLQKYMEPNFIGCHTSGQQFFKHQEKNPDLPIHLILLDLEIPYENGYMVLQKIRTMPIFAQTRVVAMTGHVGPQHVSAARHAGFDGFIGKPIQHHRFPKQVERILAGESVWEAT